MGDLDPRSEAAVAVTELAAGVVQITMQDRAEKNTFSDALMRGLIGAFETVGANESCRAVILTGYESYFCSGGTRDGLLALHEGRGKFSDVNLYGLALNCPVPVIASMQGHGIGGGFVMGLYADIVILSRESVYTTNFMNYGFTPGMGATAIVPERLGPVLAHEMMYTARNFRGEELKQRGVPFLVVPRAEVPVEALKVASLIAEKPRASLVTLKNHLTAPLRQRLPAVIEQEVAMHERTFRQSEVKDRIQSRFGL